MIWRYDRSEVGIVVGTASRMAGAEEDEGRGGSKYRGARTSRKLGRRVREGSSLLLQRPLGELLELSMALHDMNSSVSWTLEGDAYDSLERATEADSNECANRRDS